MGELLAVVASNPLSGVVVAALLFSVTLFPLGLMLGGTCDECCQLCEECETGRLPDTVTVTFSGYPDTGQGADLVTMTFSSCTGFGGAAKLLTPGGDPATAAGPMTSIAVTDGGSGYAKLGREEPTVAVQSAGNGDATFTVTLSETTDFCGLAIWEVASVTVTAGGTGYQYGQSVNFEVQGTGTAESTGSGTIVTDLEEPTVEITATPGSGAAFTVTFEADDFDANKYAIDTVTVTAGGTGYEDGTIATVTATGSSTEEAAAYLEIQTGRVEPTLTLTTGILSNGSGATYEPVLTEDTGTGRSFWKITSVTISVGGEGFVDGESIFVEPNGHTELQAFFGYALTRNDQPTLTALVLSETGTGCVIEPTLTQTTLPSGKDAWQVTGFSVSNGGSGYTAGDSVAVTVTVGQEISPIDITVQVDGTGAVTGFTVNDSGLFAIVGVLDSVVIVTEGYYYEDTGVVAAVEVIDGGIYYNDTGVVLSVTVDSPGIYYLENAAVAAVVPAISVDVFQEFPSDGSGAVLTPVVDTDTSSATFGQITGVTITNGGDDYLAWATINAYCMAGYMNGRPIVLARARLLDPAYNPSDYACWYLSTTCDPLNPFASTASSDSIASETVAFYYRFDGSTSVVRGPQVSLSTDDGIADCSDFTLSFPADSAYFAGQRSAFNAVSATVASGGGSVDSAVGPRARQCGSCCLGGNIPSEFTLSLTNLVQPGNNTSLPDGTYVMQRDASIDNIYSISHSSPLIWYGQSGNGGLFAAIIEPCARLVQEGATSLYSWRDDGCGDTCNQQCRFRLYFSGTFVGYPQLGADPGCSCSASPICEPPAGTYSMVDFNGTPSVSVTI